MLIELPVDHAFDTLTAATVMSVSHSLWTQKPFFAVEWILEQHYEVSRSVSSRGFLTAVVCTIWYDTHYSWKGVQSCVVHVSTVITGSETWPLSRCLKHKNSHGFTAKPLMNRSTTWFTTLHNSQWPIRLALWCQVSHTLAVLSCPSTRSIATCTQLPPCNHTSISNTMNIFSHMN